MTESLFTKAQFKAMAALSRGQQPKRVHRNTTQSLLNRGWAQRGRGGWLTLTEKGKAALTAECDKPVLLSAHLGGRNYTDKYEASAREEMEVIDGAARQKMQEEAKIRRAASIDRDTTEIRERIAQNITDLEGHDISAAAAKRLIRMRRELTRLERDLAA